MALEPASGAIALADKGGRSAAVLIVVTDAIGVVNVAELDRAKVYDVRVSTSHGGGARTDSE